VDKPKSLLSLYNKSDDISTSTSLLLHTRTPRSNHSNKVKRGINDSNCPITALKRVSKPAMIFKKRERKPLLTQAKSSLKDIYFYLSFDYQKKKKFEAKCREFERFNDAIPLNNLKLAVQGNKKIP